MQDTQSVYRSENKFLVSYQAAADLKIKLNTFLTPDIHSQNCSYKVKSLYFDTPFMKDYQDKLAGLEIRQKLRLRIYDEDSNIAKLELKSKLGSQQHKTSLEISGQDARLLMKGDYRPLLKYRNSDNQALRIYSILTVNGYQPAVIIEYDRTAYFYPAFHVRLTLDSYIRSCETNLDLYETNLPWTPVYTDTILLEVKFDQHLPNFIQKILMPYKLNPVSFSKYCTGRYIMKQFL